MSAQLRAQRRLLELRLDDRPGDQQVPRDRERQAAPPSDGVNGPIAELGSGTRHRLELSAGIKDALNAKHHRVIVQKRLASRVNESDRLEQRRMLQSQDELGDDLLRPAEAGDFQRDRLQRSGRGQPAPDRSCGSERPA